MRTRRGTVRLHRLGRDRRGLPRPADRVEGRGPGGQGRRRRAVAAVQGRPGHLLRSPQRLQRRARRRVPGERRRQGGAARRGREARHLRPGRGARRAAHDRRQVGRDRQGAARARRRAGATAARRREEGARRSDGRRRSGGAGPRRPIPGPRRAIRAAGGEGRGGRADQGRRGGAGQRRAVASVGRRGRRGAWQEGLGLRRPRRVIAGVVSVVLEAVQQTLVLAFGGACGVPPPRRAAARCAPTPRVPS